MWPKEALEETTLANEIYLHAGVSTHTPKAVVLRGRGMSLPWDAATTEGLTVRKGDVPSRRLHLLHCLLPARARLCRPGTQET